MTEQPDEDVQSVPPDYTAPVGPEDNAGFIGIETEHLAGRDVPGAQTGDTEVNRSD